MVQRGRYYQPVIISYHFCCAPVMWRSHNLLTSLYKYLPDLKLIFLRKLLSSLLRRNVVYNVSRERERERERERMIMRERPDLLVTQHSQQGLGGSCQGTSRQSGQQSAHCPQYIELLLLYVNVLVTCRYITNYY